MLDIMQALRNKGWQGKALALRMGVCGDGKIRRVTSYDAAQPDSIHRSLQAMQMLGISGVVHIWNGPGDSHNHQAMMACWNECQHFGMSFAVMLDQWIGKPPDPTASTVAAIKHPDFQKVLNSPIYLPEKYVLEFSLNSAANVDIGKVQVQCPRIRILSKNSGYSWVTPDIASLAKANAKPTMKIPSLCPYFNDGGYPLPNGVGTPPAQCTGRDWNKSMWGAHGTTPDNKPDDSVRVREHQGGHWWMDQADVTPISAKYVMLATWDDYEESTGVEYWAAILAGLRI